MKSKEMGRRRLLQPGGYSVNTKDVIQAGDISINWATRFISGRSHLCTGDSNGERAEPTIAAAADSFF